MWSNITAVYTNGCDLAPSNIRSAHLDHDAKKIIISFGCHGSDYTLRLKPEQFIAIMDELGDAYLDLHLKKNLESFIDSEQQEETK